MQVILVEQVPNLGKVGDIVNVKDGFGRNFLLPKGKALRATNENKKYFESKRQEIEQQNADKQKEASAIAKKFEKYSLILIRQASDDGRLFGSVTSRDIAKEINADKGSELERGHIILPSTIKNTGIFPVKIQLHPEVVVDITINIARTEDEAKEAADPKKQKAKKEAEEKANAEALKAAESAVEEANASEDATEAEAPAE